MQQAVCDALIAFMAATSQSQAEATRSKLSANRSYGSPAFHHWGGYGTDAGKSAFATLR